MCSKCEHCGEFAVDDTENIEVCKSCGIVVEETTLSNAEYPVCRTTFTPFTWSEVRLNSQKRIRKPVTLGYGQRILDNLCLVNNISSLWKTEVIELFKLAVSERKFTKREDAGTTAACCLFLLLRKHKQCISIMTLCKQVPCTKGEFSRSLKFLKTCLSSNDKFKQYSSFLTNGASDSQNKKVEDMPGVVPSLINEICEKAETVEKKELMEKTASLVKLAYSCWLFTGRSPRSVVAASAFLCWKSMHPKRKKSLFGRFSRLFEIHEPAAKFRVKEIKALLLKLGKKIPSRTENYVNSDNVLFHLNTILKNSETLRNDLFPDSHTCDEVDAIEFTNFRDPPQRKPRKEPSNAVQYDSDMNASDIEISDSEIESYLVPDKKKIIQFCKKNPKFVSQN